MRKQTAAAIRTHRGRELVRPADASAFGSRSDEPSRRIAGAPTLSAAYGCGRKYSSKRGQFDETLASDECYQRIARSSPLSPSRCSPRRPGVSSRRSSARRFVGANGCAVYRRSCALWSHSTARADGSVRDPILRAIQPAASGEPRRYGRSLARPHVLNLSRLIARAARARPRRSPRPLRLTRRPRAARPARSRPARRRQAV